MTIKEARDYLNKLDLKYDDNELVIPTQGLNCNRIKVKNLSLGFDWFNGCLCVHGESKPSHVDINQHSKLAKLYLMQKSISNLKEVDQSKTLVAQYKKQTRACKDKWDAHLWIWEQLDNELKSNE